MFSRFKEKRALKSYVVRLPALLRKDYGCVGSYTVGQVTKTIERHGLNRKYMAYACAIFVEKERFAAAYQGDAGIVYEDLKQEISDKFFLGNANFSAVDSGSDFGSIDSD